MEEIDPICDVCGRPITGDQKLIHITAIGYMHDRDEVPECKGLWENYVDENGYA